MNGAILARSGLKVQDAEVCPVRSGADLGETLHALHQLGMRDQRGSSSRRSADEQHDTKRDQGDEAEREKIHWASGPFMRPPEARFVPSRPEVAYVVETLGRRATGVLDEAARWGRFYADGNVLRGRAVRYLAILLRGQCLCRPSALGW